MRGGGGFVLERRDARGVARLVGCEAQLADAQARLVRAAARDLDRVAYLDGAAHAAVIASRLGAVVVDLTRRRVVAVYTIQPEPVYAEARA